MSPRACIEPILYGLMKSVAVVAAFGVVAAAYAPPILETAEPAPRPRPASPKDMSARSPCTETIGEVRTYIQVSHNSIPSPFSAVYDPVGAQTHPSTGHKFIVTSEEPENRQLYIIGPNGDNPDMWEPGPILQSSGRGITIGGKKTSLGQDYIWASDMNNEISMITFGGGYTHWPTIATTMGDITWDSNTNTLLIYDCGDLENQRILQYDVVSHQKVSEIPSPRSYCQGIAYDGCNSLLFISMHGAYQCFTYRPAYNASHQLTGLTDEHAYTWSNGSYLNDVNALFYRSDICQIGALNGADTSASEGIATSIDDGCLNAQQVLECCLNGPGNPPNGDDCDSWDFDQDGDVDLADFQTLQIEYESSE